ncbi:MAG: hypothetical protein HQM03_01300 [Magnetococcales bacterium]|nr:hypothetical protein [Magnetococcales bacterium]
MPFQRDVNAVPELKGHYKSGLQALLKHDRQHITCNNPTSLSGSVNIDSALLPSQPNAARWDYLVGVGHAAGKEELIWIEIHPAAHIRNIDEVCNKSQWLDQWIKKTPFEKGGTYEQQRIWIPTDKVIFTSRSKECKKLSEHGVKLKRGNAIL